MSVQHISYEPGVLRILDQTQLPAATVFVELRRALDVSAAIAQMKVRGAPAIGITAAYGLAIEAHELSRSGLDNQEFLARLKQAGSSLIAVRPTAVNLAWAVNRLLNLAEMLLAAGISQPSLAEALDAEARKIHEDDVAACRRMGELGAALLAELTSTYARSTPNQSGIRILTHCNTGNLATGGYGTALGIVRSLWSARTLAHVYVDETRPLLQGARLTAWELQTDGIPFTLISDNMAAHFMQRRMVDAVIVGADRIARNGDVANKIGTYALGLAAKAHELPFIVAAPLSTFDIKMPNGAGILIEERNPGEVTIFGGTRTAPAGAPAANPAFDVTPAEYVTAIVTELGVVRPPLQAGIDALFASTTLSKSVRQ